MPELKPRTTTVYLFQGDDYDEERRLIRAVEAAGVASVSAPVRLNEASGVVKAAEEYDEWVAAAKERAVAIELKAVSRKAWRTLMENNPSRKVTDAEGSESTDERDADYGFNFDALADDLVPMSVVDSATFTADWLDELSDGQWSQLYIAALRLNRGGSPDPFDKLSSRIARTSDETSESPARLA